jgi:hypothetical protein
MRQVGTRIAGQYLDCVPALLEERLNISDTCFGTAFAES